MLQSQVRFFFLIDGIWQQCGVSFGVDNTNSNIGAVIKFIKPLIMQLYKYNIPYADTQNYVKTVSCTFDLLYHQYFKSSTF